MSTQQARSVGSLISCLIVAALFAACGDSPRETTRVAADERPAEFVQAAARVRKLYFDKDFPGAVRSGNELVQRYPDNVELAAWHVLAIARTLDRVTARDRVLDLEKRQPNNDWTLFAKAAAMMWGRGAASKGEALQASEAALAARPAHADFVWLRAESLRLMADKSDAVAFLDANPEQLRSHVELLNVRAASLFDMALNDPSDDNKRAAALTAYERARALNPDNVIAHFAPGWFLLTLGRAEEAHPYLERAAMLSEAPMVLGYYWGSFIQRDDLTLAEKQQQVDQKISRIVDAPDVAPDILVRAASTYGQLDMPEKQFAIGERVLEGYPDSRYDEQILNSRIIARLVDANRDDALLRDALRDFLVRDTFYEPVYRRQAQRFLFRILNDDPGADAAGLYRLVMDMSQGDPQARLTAYGEGALALASRGIYLDEAEALASAGTAKVADLVDATFGRIPESARPPNMIASTESRFREALGWVYFQQGRIAEAEQALLTAYSLDNDKASVLLHLGKFYEAGENFEEAERYFVECEALPPPPRGANPCADALKAYYLRRRGNDRGFEEFLRFRHDEIEAARATRIGDGRVENPTYPPPFSLSTLDGESVALEDLAGKTVIVKFWAVWCAPCRDEMPEYAAFYERFSDVDDLVMLTITIDPNPEVTRRWMKENGLAFEVLIDDKYVREANVFGIPRTWFIGADGRKVYDLFGQSPDLENEYVARLELMGSMKRQ